MDTDSSPAALRKMFHTKDEERLDQTLARVVSWCEAMSSNDPTLPQRLLEALVGGMATPSGQGPSTYCENAAWALACTTLQVLGDCSTYVCVIA